MDYTLSISNEGDTHYPLSNDTRTIVLVGRTGNGKSATGNSILGRKAFKSKRGFLSVTRTTELQSIELNGRIINVIDTPGLFDVSATPNYISKEIVRCIQLAKDGIHAIVLVFSARSSFSREEEAVLPSFLSIFGPKITDYMIVVFTGGDELEANDETLEDYLYECPKPLQKILDACNNRYVLFDNITKDSGKKTQQLRLLLELVDKVVEENEGRPYTNEMFVQIKDRETRLHHQKEYIDSKRLQGYNNQEMSEFEELMRSSYEEQHKQIAETVESKLRDTMLRLQQQLAEEKTARLKAEMMAQASQQKSDNEIRKLQEELGRFQSRNGGFHIHFSCPYL